MPRSFSLLTGLALWASLLLCSVARSQTSLTWVKDINTTPVTVPSPSSPIPTRSAQTENSQLWLKMGSFLYFQAGTASTGRELFKSDGTTATLVKDINPGNLGSNPIYITPVGGKIYFSAFTSTAGTELWVTDGTEAGTQMVKDIRPGSSSSYPQHFARVGSKIVFSANDGVNGDEIWVTDGTAAGTTMLKDMRVGPNSSISRDYASNSAGTKVFFQSYDGVNGYQLWVTDGTAAGTKLVKIIRSGRVSSFPRHFQPLGPDKVVFQADDGIKGTELWISDGTPAGTKMVKDVFAGSSSGTSTFQAVSLGNKVLFLGTTAANGQEPWITDGTATGTFLLKDIVPGTGSSFMWFSDTDANKAYWGCRNTSGRYEIWITDGTASGTSLFSSAGMSRYRPRNLAATAGKVFFCGYSVTAGTGYELCVTDGTTTTTVKDIWPSWPSGLAPANNYVGKIGTGIVAFTADDGMGRELWVSKGTAATTKLIDVNKPVGPQATADDKVRSVEPFFGRVLFSATDGVDKTKGQRGQELWISDGTTANTKLLKDIYVGTSSTVASSSNPTSLCRLGNYVYFQANDGVNGFELWRTDGTTSGTKLFVDVRAGSGSSYPSGLTRIVDKIYFTAQAGSTGYELWVTDGTVAGTAMVKDINPGATSSNASRFARLGMTNKVIFRADSPGKGLELWITDGTAAGTQLVKDIYTGSSSSSPDYLTSYKGKVYFQANNGTLGNELWVSDGTLAGTVMVKDGIAGAGSGYARYITVVNDRLFYSGFTTGAGFEMHSSDGTAANTGLFSDMSPGVGSTQPQYITAVGSRRAYFGGQVASKGWGVEPFFIDVTDKTSMGWNANPSGSSSPDNLARSHQGFAVDNGNVYLAASKNSYSDRQLLKISNGATSQSFGRVQASSVLMATDPRIGKNMSIAVETKVSNPVSVVCLGLPDSRPFALGTFAPNSYAYFNLTSYFFVLGNFTGPAQSAVIPVPNYAHFLGARAVLQSFALNILTFPAKTEASNGVHMTFGN